MSLYRQYAERIAKVMPEFGTVEHIENELRHFYPTEEGLEADVAKIKRGRENYRLVHEAAGPGAAT